MANSVFFLSLLRVYKNLIELYSLLLVLSESLSNSFRVRGVRFGAISNILLL